MQHKYCQGTSGCHSHDNESLKLLLYHTGIGLYLDSEAKIILRSIVGSSAVDGQ